jgi:glutamyl-tRNA synthetase
MRLRFAPSPTGALHIGGARTALYNWLLARGAARRGEEGTLVLRIEDTDRERSTAENVEQILDAVRWLELDWDEGPLFQSERSERHREVVDQLLESGRAYRSPATADDVKAWKAEHGAGRGFRGEPAEEGAVRLRWPEGRTVAEDVIRGPIAFEHEHLDDLVIARADRSPVYNLAVAVDDLDFRITHVVRGEDHLSNTPKQLLVLGALGATPPNYAHLPLLHGPDGKKLSKRHGAASVQELRERGYLPEAVRNYLALLGWGYDAVTTFFSTDELIDKFSLERVSKNPAVFDEQKLRNMNGTYIRQLPAEELARRLEALLGREGLRDAAAITQEKIQTLADFWPLAGFLFDGPADDPAAFERTIGADGGAAALAEARQALAAAETWDTAGVEAALRGVVERRGVRPKDVFQPVRVAIAGTTVSPGIFESVALLGREQTLARIDQALARTRGPDPDPSG